MMCSRSVSGIKMRASHESHAFVPHFAQSSVVEEASAQTLVVLKVLKKGERSVERKEAIRMPPPGFLI